MVANVVMLVFPLTPVDTGAPGSPTCTLLYRRSKTSQYLTLLRRPNFLSACIAQHNNGHQDVLHVIVAFVFYAGVET